MPLTTPVTQNITQNITNYNFNGLDRWYVDSINGNDSNNGKTPNSAFLTIARLLQETIAPFTTIYLARGSEWFESIDFDTKNNISVVAYGVGKRPILNSGRILVTAEITKTDSYTNVYQITWATVGQYGCVWENDKQLSRKTSIAEVDANPGSCYSVDNSISNPPPRTLYFHPKNSTNPLSDGKKYEVANRAFGLALGDYCYAEGIHTKRMGSHNGNLMFHHYGYAKDCYIEDAIVHGMFLNSGTVENCIYWTNNPSSGNPIVFYIGTGNYKMSVLNCTFIGEDSSVGTGIFCHGSGVSSYSEIIIKGCKVYNIANAISVTTGDFNYIEDCLLDSCQTGIILGTASNRSLPISNIINCKIRHAPNVNTYGLVNHACGGTCIIDGLKGLVRKTSSGAIFTTGGTLTLQNSSLVLRDGISPATSWSALVSNGATVNMKNCILDGFTGHAIRVNTGALGTLSNNVYFNSSPWRNDAVTPAVNTTSLATWQSSTGQDAGSITSDPQWVGDPRLLNFELKSSSPAIALSAGASEFFSAAFDRIKAYLAAL